MTGCRLWLLGNHRQHTELHYVGGAKPMSLPLNQSLTSKTDNNINMQQVKN